ncbi:hypothetical protein [Paenibacillus alvei]|uniref:hypothetical protein n=1 Tax=Paenibacillus alvei TaxID=44250 RepID=UPI0022828178|nr:hypothetical protein [Paenibacillus alvei]MCY7484442.1 hypothetical protein [Paenibacillus alvei]
MIGFKDVVSRLTDVFTKSPNSNIGKLMSIMAGQLRKVQETQARIQEWRDIDKAEGVTLDRLGHNIVQPRGVATDEQYRILLKSKIARNFSQGDINTIIQVLATALDTEFKNIKITELYNDPIAPEPAAISLIQLPLDRINAVGIDPVQFARIVQKTVAAGVRVGVIEMTGTFAFGATETGEIDADAGFTDGNGNGGTLGAVYAPGTDQILPI